MATVNLTKGTKSFEIIKDAIPFIDEDDDEEDDEEEDKADCDNLSLNRSRSSSFTESLIHFNFSVSSDEINATIKQIIEKMPCKCDEERKEFMSKSLKLISINNESARNFFDCRKPFDDIHNHYLDCNVGICKKKHLKYMQNVAKSQESLQISTLCSICKDLDEHFQDNISSIFLPFLERINKANKNDLCSCDEKKKKKIATLIHRQMHAMNANSDFKNSFNWSTRHFKDCLSNFRSPSISPIINPLENLIDDIEEPILCDCDNRRSKIFAQFISSVILQNQKEIDEINFNSHHFKSCSKKLSSSELSPSYSFSALPYNENSPVFDNYSPKSASKKSRRKHSVSTDSIKYLDQVLQDIKGENKIECPMETISYFLKCKKYEHYEKGLEKVLDSKPTIENMRLFFYLTRMIVRHVDDPNSGENQEIGEILEFSETFLFKHFYDEIKSQSGLEKFILGIDSLD